MINDNQRQEEDDTLMNGTARPDKPREAVGYVRVSSKMQAEDGSSLENQVNVLKEWAQANGYRATSIYQDVGSAVGSKNLDRRPEFLQAVREALQAGLPLIVTDATRISRDLATLERLVIDQNLTVISVEEGGIVPVGVLRQRVAAGAEQAKAIRKGTREALRRGGDARKKASASSRQKAAQASVRSRVERKHAVLDQVADYLQANPELRHAKSREIADKLNDAGILSGWNRPWTPGAVRGKWKAIVAELDFRREMATEDAADTPSEAGDLTTTVSPASTAPATPTTVTPRSGPWPSSAPAPQPEPVIRQRSLDADNAPAEDPEEDEESAMRKLPYFGMF